MLIPGQQTPDLQLATLGHGHFDLASKAPAFMTLICFYRGAHCAICRRYLAQLASMQAQFLEREVRVVAVSMDGSERTGLLAEAVETEPMRIGYGMTAEQARAWGLYLSSGRGKTSVGLEEPAVFSEPALFLVKPDRSLYYASVQSMPFARPHWSEVLDMIDFAKKHDYPGRGTVAR